jgi:hypothetical protein
VLIHVVGSGCCRWLQPQDSLQLLLTIAEVDEFLESRLGLNAAERALIYNTFKSRIPAKAGTARHSLQSPAMSPKLWHLALTVIAHQRRLITPSGCYTAKTEAVGTRH